MDWQIDSLIIIFQVVFLPQVQGFRELFGDSCEGVISWLNGASYYTAFTEGWALYAENPLIAEETDAYDNDPLQLYGMLKWQIWRALRLMMDTGLHYKGLLLVSLDTKLQGQLVLCLGKIDTFGSVIRVKL